MPTPNAFEVYRGQDWGPQPFTTTPAVNITGWAIRAVLRARTGGPALVTKSTATTGVTITDATNGTFTVTLLAADTASLELGGYKLFVERTDAGVRDELSPSDITLLDSAF